jgi:hypothetical protein
MGDVEADLRAQLTDAFEGADYPVSGPMNLVPALPNGPGTTFEAGEVSITAMELSTKFGGDQDFPYEDVDALVEDVLLGLESEDII